MALKRATERLDEFESRPVRKEIDSEPQLGAFLLSDKKPVPKPVPGGTYRKRFVEMRLPYKLPTIVRSKNGDWFVKYFYEDPEQIGVYKEFRVRDGINREHDDKSKEAAILQLQKDVKDALQKHDFNPFALQKSIKQEIDAKLDLLYGKWTLQQGLDAFMTYCSWKELSPKTISSYRTFVNNFTDWLTDTNQLDNPAHLYLETDLLKFADSYYDQEDWTPRTYNNHVDFFKTLFKRMEILERKEDRALKYQINLEDLELKTDKAEKNRAYSGIVADRVKKELEKPKYKNLNSFVQFIYFSCMRPKEIRLLQIQHIDLTNRQIKVTGPTGKTGDRFVPISDELHHLLVELDFHKLPLNYFLFGQRGEPSDLPFKRDYFSDIYVNIKKALGLDIHIYTMYGWKHTRVIDLINAGFTDNEVMQLTGHRDYQAFLAYKRDLMIATSVMKGKTMGWKS